MSVINETSKNQIDFLERVAICNEKSLTAAVQRTYSDLQTTMNDVQSKILNYDFELKSINEKNAQLIDTDNHLRSKIDNHNNVQPLEIFQQQNPSVFANSRPSTSQSCQRDTLVEDLVAQNRRLEGEILNSNSF